MSAMTSARMTSARATKPAARPAVKRATTPLRLVQPRHSSAAKTPFVVVVVTLLVAGLLGLLLLNTLVAQDSFALHDLSKQGKQLEQREQDLIKQVQAMQAPGALADRATALGMVPGGPPAFLRLSDGAVLGQPTAGVALPPPVVASTTWTAPKAPSTPGGGRAPKKAATTTGVSR